MCTASLHCPRPDKVPTSGLAAYALFAQDNAAVNRFYIRHAVLRTDNDCKGRPALHLISYFELREVLLTWYVYCVSAAEAATKQGVKYWHLLQDNVKAASSLSDVSSNVLKTDDQDEDIVFWQLVCRAAYIDFPGLVHASLFAGRWVDAASDLSSNTFFLQNYMIKSRKAGRLNMELEKTSQQCTRRHQLKHGHRVTPTWLIGDAAGACNLLLIWYTRVLTQRQACSTASSRSEVNLYRIAGSPQCEFATIQTEHKACMWSWRMHSRRVHCQSG